MTTKKNTPQVGDIVQTRSGTHAMAAREGKLLRIVGNLAEIDFEGDLRRLRLQDLETVEAVGVMDEIRAAGNTELRQKIRFTREED